MTRLLGDEEYEIDFRINEKFAAKYQEKKKKEELSLLEDKYKEKLAKKGARFIDKTDEDANEETDTEGTDSESDVTEDEDGELATPAIEAQILKTMASIRARDQKIYDPNAKFFSPEELAQAEAEWRAKKKTQPRDKPMRIKDFHRERLLGGLDTKNENGPERLQTHEEEQTELLNAFKSAITERDNVEPEEDNDLLRIRPKTVEEVAKEDEEYKNFLLENLATSENAKESMGEWFGRRSEQGIEANDEEQFLIDYVLSRGWVDNERKSLPTYDQIVADDEEDAEAVDRQEEFEEKYNFRFEQPDGDRIMTYSRTTEGSMRRESSRRKEQRAARRARKAEEKEKQREELKRLKNLKKLEIEEKLRKIQNISGSSGIAGVDLEDDFDPETYDKKMESIFNDDYYGHDDESKPIFSESENEDGHGLENRVIEKVTKTMAKVVRRMNKNASGNEKEKEKEKRKTIDKILDEYYQLDYEDMIDDLPCRFKYESVRSTTFGLKIKDILIADDTELNAHVSLKKLAPYRSAEAMKHDEEKYSNRKRLYKFYDLIGNKRKFRPDGKETKKKNNK